MYQEIHYIRDTLYIIIIMSIYYYNKYMKDYDKNKELPYLKYWDVNNFYGWAMSQKLPVNDFEWVEDTSQFEEDFIKNYNEESEWRYFLEADMQYPDNLKQAKTGKYL